MKEFTSTDFSLSLAKLYVSQFEDECPGGDKVADELLRVLMMYQQKLSELGRRGGVGLQGLADAKAAVRLSGLLLDELRRDFGGMMQSWLPGVRAKNGAQVAANLVNEIISELSKTIAEVESEHPELRAMFQQERIAFYREQSNWVM